MMNAGASHRARSSGFTLIEILLVAALSAGLLTASIPFGVQSYRMTELDETLLGVRDTLMNAETSALFGVHGSAWGVHVEQGSYTLFEGDTYGSRLPLSDRVMPMTPSVTVVGPEEIVFARLTGFPSQDATMTISSVAGSAQVTILSSGVISVLPL